MKDLLAVLRFAQNPRGRMAGFRVTQLIPGIGQATATRLLDAMGEAAEPTQALQQFEPPAQAREEWSRFVAALRAAARPRCRLAGRPGTGEGLVPAAARTHPRRRARAQARRGSAGAAGRRLCQPRALPHRADAGSAASHQRPVGRAAPGRGLPDPVHHPQRQGPGMEGRARAQRGGRLHPQRHGDRHDRRAGGRAAPAVRGDDARQGTPAPDRAAPLLRDAAGRRRRPPVYAGRSRFITEAMAGQFERVTWPRGRRERRRRQRSRRRRCCRCGPAPAPPGAEQALPARAGTASYAAAQALPTTAVFRPA